MIFQAVFTVVAVWGKPCSQLFMDEFLATLYITNGAFHKLQRPTI